MVREKHKLDVTFDIEEAFDFVRFMFKDHKVEFQKNLETIFDQAKNSANLTFFAGLHVTHISKNVDLGDYTSGIISGLCLALAVARPNEEISVRDFLARHAKKGENVVDIMDAFRKQAKQ